jgi:hypothetical protein
MRLGLARLLTVVLFAAVMFFCARTYAQTTNATVTGQITDQSGRLVPGAAVVFTNINTSVPYTAQTNGEGIYSLPAVQPGVYRANITKDGFKSIVKPDIELHVQDQVSINFALQIGSVSETITVEAGGLYINTTDGSVSTVVDQSYIQNMPLNGRSFQDLILLTPGVVTQTPQLGPVSQLGATGEFSVNGQRPESNYYTVDGVSANVGAAPGISMTGTAGASGSVAAATALGTTQALVSVDDLQEFRVQSSTYSAEYGRNPGGQFAFETKSGTNQWHGTAYDYLRNGVFDANDWFNDYLGVLEPSLRQNDFGGTFGGPVDIPALYEGKSRTFFFVSYEGLRLDQPQAATVTYVPDATLRATTPAPLQQVLNAFPVANGADDVATGVAQFKSSWSDPSSLNSTSVRLDHAVNAKLTLFFRFSDTPSSAGIRESGSFANPAEYNSSEYASRTYTAGANSMFTSHVSNEFRFNYSSNHVVESQVINSFGGNTPVDLAQLSGVGPSAQIAILLFLGSNDVGIEQTQLSGVQRQWNLVDTVVLAVGRHQLKFGVDYRRLTPTSINFNPANDYLYFGTSAVQSNSGLAIADSYAPAFPLYTNFSAFAQDEWRVTPRLSVSLGLRWEVNPAPGVTQGLKPYAIEGTDPTTATLAPQGTPLWKTTWGNFAPRFGVAYVLRDSPKYETVIRGGAGIFYDTGQQLASTGFEGPGFSAGSVIPGSFPLPAAAAAPPIVNPPVPPYNVAVYVFPSHLQLPYTVQWNASIAQALGKPQVLTVSYIGSHAARLLEQAEISNPNASAFFLNKNGLTSDYDALQIQFQRRLSQGLTALASYTWSHCIDYGSQDYFFPYQRGDCDFDIRHNLSAAFSYTVPNVGQNGFLRAVLHHWGLDDRFTARTGFPVTLQGTTMIDPATGQSFNSGLDLVPGEPVYVYGSECAAVYDNGLTCPGGRAINPNAFSLPASGLGDAPRNFTEGFGAWQMDLAVRRDFPIYENLKLQFRAEAFNVFNHPNFGTINATYCPPGPTCTFGQATGTLASTLGILSPLYQQGGPRSMQFALKLIF